MVWSATDLVLRREVAVKVLAGPLAADPGARLRIQAEARAAAKLSHPHVAAVYDFGESPDEDGQPVPFVVMELLHGPTLRSRLADGPIPVPEALRLCAEVASGLAAAHAAGLVHRDVKPANVVLTPSGAKVVDFGIAAAVGPLDDLDEDNRYVGTPAFLAPERLTGGDVTTASDVYALGLLLYFVLSGRLPWQVETTTQMLKAHVYVEPKPLPSLPGVPPQVVDLCRQCLAKEPDDRPSAAQVAEILAGVGAGGDAPPVAVPRERGRRRTALLTIAAVSAVVVVAAASLLADPAGITGGPETEVSAQDGGAADPSATPTGAGTPPPRASWPGSPPIVGTRDTTRPGATATTGGPPAGPGGPGPGPSTSVESTATAAPEQRTFTSEGGTVVAECVGTLAHAVSFEPAEGYSVQKAEVGPAALVRIWFKIKQPVKMNIRCVNGVPTLDG
ncbi:hypothetical protein Prum_003450 [Phytohabitans rumicis]|uniref:non-specific serine/threonine protein kinase n=1 Tax=Phytohabitans rumicis TaxID=1076125 RepID=A0A6V8KNG4_9ACTN|nr:hypothetical protein Prum_003450 [Phytohabitans rumicis]